MVNMLTLLFLIKLTFLINMSKDILGMFLAVHKPGFFIWNLSGLLNQQVAIIPGPRGWGNATKIQVYKIKKMHHIRLKKNPGEPSRSCSVMESSIETCLKSYYQNKTNCTIADNKPANCSTQKDLDKFQKLVQDTGSFTEKDFVSSTKCHYPCTIEHYDVTSFFKGTAARKNSQCKLLLQLFFDTNKVSTKKEILLYDDNNLIADIGGYLGLLLGVSAFSLYKGIVLAFETGMKKILNLQS